MIKPARLLTTGAAALLLFSMTGCNYDYSYTSFGYSYGYDCSPRYYNSWDCDYSYSRYYHAPCDGVRFRTGYTTGYSYSSYGGYGGHHHVPCR